MKVNTPFAVESYETDINRRMKPAALQSRLQELAYVAVAAAGTGYADLRRQGRFWALNRMHINVSEWPVWGDELCLTTWCSDRTGPLYQRNYILVRDGETIARATSSWSVLNLEGRGVCRDMVFPREIMEDGQPLPYCEKVLLPQDLTPASAGSHTASYSDLDSNAHVNNCTYMQWAMDIVGLDFLGSHRY